MPTIRLSLSIFFLLLAIGLPGVAAKSSNAAGRVIATIQTGNSPYGVAYDSGNGYVYVANSNLYVSCGLDVDCGGGCGYGSVSVISGTRVVATVPLGDATAPKGIVYDSKNGYVYVTNSNSCNFTGLRGTVSVISGTTVVTTITVGYSWPDGIAYDSGNGFVYVANSACEGSGCGTGTVTVINGTSVIPCESCNPVLPEGSTVLTGNEPDGVAYDSGNGYVYVANALSNDVSVISGTTLIATVPVGTEPYGVAYDSGSGNIYVANTGSNTVSIISGTSVVSTVSGVGQPWSLTYDTRNGLMYVASSNEVFVIDGTSVVGSFSIGGNHFGVGYDSRNGNIYVANSSSSTVSVIKAPHLDVQHDSVFQNS